jgi:serine/threonine protein kinase
MQQLRKIRYYGRGNSDKYYIDCSHYSENPDSLEIETLIKNTKTPDVAILKAVATDETIKKKNRHIVVKISREKVKNTQEYMVQKEYKIGQLVVPLAGFIKYICIFACYDDTNRAFDTINAGENEIRVTTKICNATEKTHENWKYVLVMPYIQGGSIENHIWTSENIVLLKNLIIHTILSLATAFYKLGFVHGDCHLGNVLFKKTKITEIKYTYDENNIVVATHGHKVVIMDFEKSIVDVKNPQYFWSDVKTFIGRINCIQNDTQRVKWNNQIISFVDEMIEHIKPLKNNVLKLVKMIDKSKLDVVTLQSLVYDPNVF